MLEINASKSLELPVDELAIKILADLQATREWNAYNYHLLYEQDRSKGYGDNEAARKAIDEALQWLTNRGMVAKLLKDSSGNGIFITRWGHEALKMKPEDIKAVERLQENLHPLIQNKVRRQFLLGEYENAIFVGMKAIEVRVRKLGGFTNSDVGADLLKKAFRAGGPLADPSAPPGEVDGTMALFWGAYAVLRNPSGHREVSFDDVTEASEAVMTASLLMRILDRVETRITQP
jgi:uncharacterized protein (TIGR02391 family)